jgi:hypothetical protein
MEEKLIYPEEYTVLCQINNNNFQWQFKKTAVIILCVLFSLKCNDTI